MPLAEPVLIIALSGRALAQSARAAGFAPIVLDAFADLDTRAAATVWRCLPVDVDWRFVAAPLLEAAAELAPPPIPLVWGSGFERSPALLAKLAQGRELLGCPPEIVRRAKDPFLLATLAGRLGLPVPEVRATPPADPAGWLAKRRGGAGGAHVRAAGGPCRAGDYFQRQVEGRPVSVLVAGTGTTARALGFSRQWPSPTAAAPFRYGGALAPAPLPPRPARELGAAAEALATALGLIGLGSVDALAGEEGFSLLELNPRPGAALPVHERACGRSFFGVHVAACRGELPETAPQTLQAACAEILWAPHDLHVPPGFVWPAWTSDRGPPGTLVPAGGPICTVRVEAADGEAAMALVGERARLLLEGLLKPAGSRSASGG